MTGGRTDQGALLARLAGEGLIAESWSNGPGDAYAPHAHAYDKVIVVARGSIRFQIQADDGAIELDIGDRLDLAAGTVHGAAVGPEGVTCLEAHRPAGWLGASRRRLAGDW